METSLYLWLYELLQQISSFLHSCLPSLVSCVITLLVYKMGRATHTNSLKFESEISLKNGVQNRYAILRAQPVGGISRRGGASARLSQESRSSEGRMPQTGAVSAADWG